jgi:hypothetical protein
MVTSVAADPLPAAFALEQNYPNPFNPATVVRYRVAATGHVRLVIHDLLGREVAILVNERKEPGTYDVTFDARLAGVPAGGGNGLASGTYLCRLTAGSSVQTKKMLLLQ